VALVSLLLVLGAATGKLNEKLTGASYSNSEPYSDLHEKQNSERFRICKNATSLKAEVLEG
jgi:hypothetical protein